MSTFGSFSPTTSLFQWPSPYSAFHSSSLTTLPKWNQRLLLVWIRRSRCSVTQCFGSLAVSLISPPSVIDTSGFSQPGTAISIVSISFL